MSGVLRYVLIASLLRLVSRRNEKQKRLLGVGVLLQPNLILNPRQFFLVFMGKLGN